MGEVSTIGLDIAKSVFQIHGVDVDGVVVTRLPDHTLASSLQRPLVNFSTSEICHVSRMACLSVRRGVMLPVGPDGSPSCAM